jgi:uncharacterized membrane protein
VLAIVRSVFVSVLFVLYPYLAYRGIQEGVVWLAPAIIAGFYIYQAFNSPQKVMVKKLAIALVLVLGAVYVQSLTAKLLPILIQIMLMHLFGKTLIKGPVLIERFVRIDYPELPAEVTAYCRQLTVIWTGFFALNVVMCIVLAIWAPASWWAIYTGILILVFTGGLMIGEYIYRHYRFPGWEIPSPKSAFQAMIVNGRKIWLDVHAG